MLMVTLMTGQPRWDRAELTFSSRAAMLLEVTLDILTFCNDGGEDESGVVRGFCCAEGCKGKGHA